MPSVLLVEDNPDVREMMAFALQLAGNNVWTASNGLEALSLLREGSRPCLIVLDLMMPVMNGWELRAALEQDPRFNGIPVIIVSALGAEIAERLHATDYLPKPVDIDRLLEVVCEHCH